MASIGSGYDFSPHVTSPDGSNFQVLYAQKSVDRYGTIVGIRCSDGVVLAAENIRRSPLLVKGTCPKITTVENRFGVAFTGRMADARQMRDKCIEECQNWRYQSAEEMPVKLLADRVSLNLQVFTMYSGYRPVGVGIMFAGWDTIHGPQLWGTDPSGDCFGYFGHAIGKASRGAKSELEKLDLKTITCEQAIKEAARIIYQIHDSVQDRFFELELSVVSKATKGVHQRVTGPTFDAAVTFAKEALNAEMDPSDSDDEDSDDDA